jgi:hypothetical protein
MSLFPPRKALTGSVANTGAPGILDPDRDDITSATSRLAAAATRVFVMLLGAKRGREAVETCLGKEQLADITRALDRPLLDVRQLHPL